MLHSSCEESCNHHHLPPQYPFSGNYPGTDAITNPVNALRYPANAGQLSRATFSGARTIMVFSGSGFYATLPIFSGISAVASLPIFLINHFTNSVINYTEQQGSLRSYADVAKTQHSKTKIIITITVICPNQFRHCFICQIAVIVIWQKN